MDEEVQEVKDAALAYSIALEYDVCPDASELEEMLEDFPDMTEAILNKYSGMRPDEIANKLVKLIEQLP